MSSYPDFPNSRALDSVLTTDAYCACLALLLCEYLALLEHEVRFVWHRKWSLATCILLVNRYLTLAVVLSNVMPVLPQICLNRIAILFMEFFQISPKAMLAVFASLRAYALSRKLSIGIVIFALGILPSVLDCYEMFLVSDYVVIKRWNICESLHSNFSPRTNFAFSMVTRFSLAVSETITIAVTWRATFRQARLAKQLNMQSLSITILRDGSAYFIVLLGMSALQLVDSVTHSTGSWSDAIAVYNEIIPNILISRFILNLRAAADNSCGGTSTEDQNPSQALSRVRFCLPTLTVDTIIGPLGESLEINDHDDVIDEVVIRDSTPECTIGLANHEDIGHSGATRV